MGNPISVDEFLNFTAHGKKEILICDFGNGGEGNVVYQMALPFYVPIYSSWTDRGRIMGPHGVCWWL